MSDTTSCCVIMLMGSDSRQKLPSGNTERECRLERQVHQLCRLLEANLVANDYCSNPSGRPGRWSSFLTSENPQYDAGHCDYTGFDCPTSEDGQRGEDVSNDIFLDRINTSLDYRDGEGRKHAVRELGPHNSECGGKKPDEVARTKFTNLPHPPSSSFASDLRRHAVSNEQTCPEQISCDCEPKRRPVKSSRSLPMTPSGYQEKISRPKSLNNLSSPSSSSRLCKNSWTPNITAWKNGKQDNRDRRKTARVHFQPSLLSSADDAPRLSLKEKTKCNCVRSSSRFCSPSST